jgi:hypothetical protein
MTQVVPLGLAVAAALCWPARPGPGNRLRALGSPPRSAVAAPAAALRARFVLGAVAAVAAGVVVGMPLWVPAAGVGALAFGGWRRTCRPEPRGDVPLVADLMASCLAAGVSMPSAIRAAASAAGPAAAPEISRAAERLRMRGNAEAQRRIARAGVWVVLPLGLCFLPAFVLVGVVPVAVGLLQHLH